MKKSEQVDRRNKRRNITTHTYTYIYIYTKRKKKVQESKTSHRLVKRNPL